MTSHWEVIFLLFAIGSAGQIIQRNLIKICKADQNLQAGFTRHQLIVLICFLRYIAINRNLKL